MDGWPAAGVTAEECAVCSPAGLAGAFTLSLPGANTGFAPWRTGTGAAAGEAAAFVATGARTAVRAGTATGLEFEEELERAMAATMPARRRAMPAVPPIRTAGLQSAVRSWAGQITRRSRCHPSCSKGHLTASRRARKRSAPGHTIRSSTIHATSLTGLVVAARLEGSLRAFVLALI